MTVVSNASPLIALARIGKLGLLASLYGRVLIPKEVHEEVTAQGRGLPGAEEVRRADWIEVRTGPYGPGVEPAGLVGLGAGERSTILLARSLGAELVLIDERKARRAARELGLEVAGCIGILEAGARRGLVDDLRVVYADLLRQGMRFETRLLQDSLRRFGRDLL